MIQFDKYHISELNHTSMSAVKREQGRNSALENLHRPHKYLGWDTK